MTKKVTDSSFRSEVKNSKIPVLVDFYADWCAPCKTVSPVIDKLSREFQGKIKVVKINIQDNQRVAQEYGVRSIPTVSIFKNGKSVASLIGAYPKTEYVKLIKKVL
jgi:thioredoxin